METRSKVQETVTFYPFLLLTSSGDPRMLNTAARGLSIVLDTEQEWLNVVHIHGVKFLVALLQADDIQWLVYVMDRIQALARHQFTCGHCSNPPTMVRWHCHQCEADFCRDCQPAIQQNHDRTHEVAPFEPDFRQNLVEQGVLPRLADTVSQMLNVEELVAPQVLTSHPSLCLLLENCQRDLSSSRSTLFPW